MIAARARLIRSDGEVVEVEGLRLERDTLHAMTPRVRGARQTVVVPLSRARGLEVRRFSSERTLGMLAAIAFFAGAALLYLWETSGD